MRTENQIYTVDSVFEIIENSEYLWDELQYALHRSFVKYYNRSILLCNPSRITSEAKQTAKASNPKLDLRYFSQTYLKEIYQNEYTEFRDCTANNAEIMNQEIFDKNIFSGLYNFFSGKYKMSSEYLLSELNYAITYIHIMLQQDVYTAKEYSDILHIRYVLTEWKKHIQRYQTALDRDNAIKLAKKLQKLGN